MRRAFVPAVALMVWFTPEAVAGWTAEPRTGRGRQPTYSSGDRHGPDAVPGRGADRLRPATARSRSPGAGSQHPEPPDRDAGGATTAGGEGAGAPAGGQHGAEVLRPR